MGGYIGYGHKCPDQRRSERLISAQPNRAEGANNMEIDRWVDGYKVRSFPWIDGKSIYFNVQYYKPGQSISQPPAFDKTVYITNSPAGQQILSNRLSSLAQYVATLQIPEGGKVILTAKSSAGG